jgi:hypothetical protein
VSWEIIFEQKKLVPWAGSWNCLKRSRFAFLFPAAQQNVVMRLGEGRKEVFSSLHADRRFLSRGHVLAAALHIALRIVDGRNHTPDHLGLNMNFINSRFHGGAVSSCDYVP